MEVRGEDRGSDGSRGPDSTHFLLYSKPARVRVTDPDMMIYPSAGGEDLTGRTAAAAGCESPSSDGPGSSRMSPTDGPTVFPPLPPPPPPSGIGPQGSVDESDQQDGPEYEEEEVVFPLSAPPTNQ